jgi:hypothetical protein
MEFETFTITDSEEPPLSDKDRHDPAEELTVARHAAHCDLFDGQDICTCGALCEHFWLPIYYPVEPARDPGVLDTRPHARCTECGKTQPSQADTGTA